MIGPTRTPCPHAITRPWCSRGYSAASATWESGTSAAPNPPCKQPNATILARWWRAHSRRAQREPMARSTIPLAGRNARRATRRAAWRWHPSHVRRQHPGDLSCVACSPACMCGSATLTMSRRSYERVASTDATESTARRFASERSVTSVASRRASVQECEPAIEATMRAGNRSSLCVCAAAQRRVVRRDVDRNRTGTRWTTSPVARSVLRGNRRTPRRGRCA